MFENLNVYRAGDGNMSSTFGRGDDDQNRMDIKLNGSTSKKTLGLEAIQSLDMSKKGSYLIKPAGL